MKIGCRTHLCHLILWAIFIAGGSASRKKTRGDFGGKTMKTYNFGYVPNVYDLAVIILALALSLTMGCTSMFTSKTKATWTEPGGKMVSYESDKEQVGLEASFDKDGTFHIRVDKAGTNEAAIAAALQSNLEVQKQLNALMQIIVPLAKAGVTKGVVP